MRPQLSGDEWQTLLIAVPNVPAPHQSDAPGTLSEKDVVGKETFDNPSTAAAPDPVRDPVCACARPRDQGSYGLKRLVTPDLRRHARNRLDRRWLEERGLNPGWV
uniref:Uncharacterized protein n=1 Tax=Timema cristinae TaxID=61476 RepID=A0A7R9CS28_TIMCR|nr:unnamed protein product [Timema cristinae]